MAIVTLDIFNMWRAIPTFYYIYLDKLLLSLQHQ